MLSVKGLTGAGYLKRSISLVSFCMFGGHVSAQITNGPITLSSPNTTGTYISTTSITLTPGFTSTAPFSALIQNPPNPSSNQNYTITYTPRVNGIITSVGLNIASSDKTQLQTAIQYFDGLGRPMQTVEVKGSPTGMDLVQPIVYDQLGREVLKYLPYSAPTTQTSDGSYKSTAITDQFNFYDPPGSSGTQLPGGVPRITSPYAGVSYESSPLNRLVEQGAPGDPWQLGSGHTVKVAYGTNVAGDIILWAVNTSGGASGNTTYPANVLFTVTKTDEMGNNSIEYKDMLGRIVCKRAQNGASTYLSTYYVYDDFNQLSYVIPPIPASVTYPTAFTESDVDPIFSSFIYGYHYDARHRLVEKKIPGKKWEFYVYNSIDKLVATQDGVQRHKATQEWTFTKYDAQGRPVLTGVYQYSGSSPDVNYRLTLQGTVDGQAQLWETPTGAGNGYSAAAWPVNWSGTPLTVNYYDNYVQVPNLPSSYGAPSGNNPSNRGQLTASLTNVLGSNDMLFDVNYYDDLGRVMKSYKQHYFGGVGSVNNYDVFTPTYNFTNTITANTRQHFINNSGNLLLNATIANTYNYDHTGRKTQTFEQINGGTNVMLSQFAYNEVGQLYQKKLHSEDNGNNFIETVSTTYNQRGWLSEISSPNFDEKLYYDNPSGNVAGLTGLYNGNILEAWYNSPQYVSNVGFVYGYDPLNRLISSHYIAGANTGKLDENVSYDNMGNITQLVRGDNGVLQGFVYSGTFAYTSYTGNQVNTILNNGIAYRNYTYDKNGNAVTAGNFGYDYNILDLPSDIKSNGTVFNTYTYDANGQKLRKVSTSSTYTTDYIDGIQYQNGVIQFIETEEGRFENTGSPVYQYDLKDHLGSVRTIIQKSTASIAVAEQENEYYAFGLNVARYENSTNNKYLYNHKELQDENALNQYDYGARFYDPVIARWNTVDPLAEINQSSSVYNYVENNPINLIDPNGMASGDPNSAEADAEDVAYNNNRFNEAQKKQRESLDEMEAKQKVAQTNAAAAQTALAAGDYSAIPMNSTWLPEIHITSWSQLVPAIQYEAYQTRFYQRKPQSINYYEKALELTGSVYHLGYSDRVRCDCSGTVIYATGNVGIKPRWTSNSGQPPGDLQQIYPSTQSYQAFLAELKRGDILVFPNPHGYGHVVWFDGALDRNGRPGIFNAHGNTDKTQTGITHDLQYYIKYFNRYPNVYRQIQ